MAFNKIRGSQIRSNAITEDHLAQSAIRTILESKLVVDYVQLTDPIVINETGNSNAITISGTPVLEDDLESLGVLLGKRVIIRNAETGETFYNPTEDHKHEVFGKLTYSEENGYILLFGCYENDGTFTPFEMEVGTKIDVQYAQRFTLFDVDEAFASNEKFVDGTIDVTTSIKIKELKNRLEQLEANNPEGVEDLRQALQGQIDAIQEAIGTDATEDTYNKTEDETPQDSKTYYVIKQEGEGYEEAIIDGSFEEGKEYFELTPGSPATGIKKILADYKLRIETIEGEIDDLQKADEEISKKLSSNKKYVVQITEEMDKTQIMLPTGMYFKKITGIDGIYEDALYVYINGILQAEDINFTQIEVEGNEGFCNGVRFGGEQLIEGDIIIFKWVNVELPIKIVK